MTDRSPLPRGKPQIRPLTSLRFCAALGVFLAHAASLHDNFASGQMIDGVSFSYPGLRTQGAQLGVTFFFVLSGFIMTYMYARRFTVLSTESVLRYYVARIARIWPVYLVMLLVAVVLMAREIADAPRYLGVAIPIHALMLQAWFPIGGGGGLPIALNAPAWSLTSEVLFYAVFPFMAYGLTSVLKMRLRPMVALMVGGWALVATAAYLTDGLAATDWIFYNHPLMRMLDFYSGMVIGLTWLGSRESPTSGDAAARRASSRSWALQMTLLECGVIAVLAVLVLLSGNVPMALTRDVYYLPAATVTVAVFSLDDGMVSRLLSSRAMVFLGEISYALFLCHFLVLRYAYAQLGAAAHGSELAITAIALCVSLMLSAFLHVAIERPAQSRWRRRGDAAVARLLK